jgi:hypothetical protein
MKNEHHHTFDTQIRDKFENFEVKVPSHLWDNISQALDDAEQPKVRSLPPRSAHARLWWAAASLLFCASLGWWMISDEQPTVYLQAKKIETMSHEPSNTTTETTLPTILSEESPLITEPHLRFATNKDVERLNDPSDLVHSEEDSWEKPKSLTTVQHFASVSSAEAQTPRAAVSLESKAISNIALTWEPRVESRALRVSDMLNFMVAQVDKRDEKWIVFSDDDEGSLLIDFNLGLARTN